MGKTAALHQTALRAYRRLFYRVIDLWRRRNPPVMVEAILRVTY